MAAKDEAIEIGSWQLNVAVEVFVKFQDGC